MRSVHVYSAGRGPALRHYERTVEHGIALESIMPSIKDGQNATVLDIEYREHGNGKCYLWGDRGGDHGRMYWDRIKIGDLALCYSEKSIIAASYVVEKIISEEIARVAWPDVEGEPFRLLFFLTRPRFMRVPVERFPQYFGKSYQGLRRLPTSEKILADFGTLDAFIRRALLGEEHPDANDSATPTDQSYSPSDEDTRALTQRLIRMRRGQPQFRDSLKARYGEVCMITGCSTFDVVEAAHIKPYRGDNDNNPENGLLFRSDVHTLFDLDLLGINPGTLCVELHPSVQSEEYNILRGVRLRCGELTPSHVALEQRWAKFKSRQST